MQSRREKLFVRLIIEELELPSLDPNFFLRRARKKMTKNAREIINLQIIFYWMELKQKHDKSTWRKMFSFLQAYWWLIVIRWIFLLLLLFCSFSVLFQKEVVCFSSNQVTIISTHRWDDYEKFSPQRRSSIFASNEVSLATNVFGLQASLRLHKVNLYQFS